MKHPIEVRYEQMSAVLYGRPAARAELIIRIKTETVGLALFHSLGFIVHIIPQREVSRKILGVAVYQIGILYKTFPLGSIHAFYSKLIMAAQCGRLVEIPMRYPVRERLVCSYKRNDRYGK